MQIYKNFYPKQRIEKKDYTLFRFAFVYQIEKRTIEITATTDAITREKSGKIPNPSGATQMYEAQIAVINKAGIRVIIK